VQSTLDYQFNPTQTGTYYFLPYVLTQDYPTPQTLDSSQWVTVVVTANTGGTCPDGSAAPNGDPSQCTCAQGNTSACVCPTGSTCGACTSGYGASCACPTGYEAEGGQCVSTSCPVGYEEDGGQCVFIGCPAGYSDQNDQCVFVECHSGYTQETVNGEIECVASQCTPQYLCGDDGNLYYEDNSCNETLYKQCAYGCSGGQCSPPPAGQIVSFSVSPSIVQKGESATVAWSAVNVSSCSISGTNGDSWTGINGSQPSSPILGQTIYTLNCVGEDGNPVSGTATVNIVPNFNEQ
jgi:hypothetical protein